ncbi:hypothetical protein AVEN_232552-1 [Araneus ventricosus]|uniref:Uncharacterized protein n=1 Tax=Araneus ventricosus TaxID=182803 RepID=A0A4Y2KL00_ARAVE|nr:hypothetical protein AVEN_232552-1 [Araneus ventricosus]
MKHRPRWPNDWLREGGFEVRSPILLKIRRAWVLLHVKSYVEHPPADVAWKFGKRVPAQVSFLSSDSRSKWQVQSQNSPRVATEKGHYYN